MGLKRLIECCVVAVVLGIATPPPCIAETNQAESGAHHDAHGSGGINFIEFGVDGSHPLAALFLNFVVLIIAVYLIMRKPIGKQFKERKETLEKAIEEARETKSLAEASLKEAKEKINALETEVERVRQEIISAGEKESERIIEEANTRTERLLDDTRALVGHEAHRIADAIREEAVVAIVQTAEEIIREKIEKNDHERLTSSYIKQIIEDSNLNDSVAPSGPGK